jgi:hypothetical protein
MRQNQHPSAARAALPAQPAKTDPSDPLFAAHDVLKFLSHVRFTMMDAEFQASNGHLDDIALLIREHIAGVNRLLPVVMATVKALEDARKAVKQ